LVEFVKRRNDNTLKFGKIKGSSSKATGFYAVKLMEI
jgi:hypothetical protein